MSLTVYFKLIRWKNLLLVTYIFLIIKLLFFPSFYVETMLTGFQFFILLLSILLITAAGNIFNDIQDIKADLINEPQKVIVSKFVTVENAKRWYKITNTSGIVLGIALCLKIEKPTYSFFFIGAALLLYYYSIKLKSKPFIGNLVISFLIAFSILILGIFEIDFSVKNEYQNIAINIIIVLSIFAFTLNLIREIVKDIEDINGDNALNNKTLPIIFGINRIKVFSSFLCIIPIALIMLLIINYSHIYKITMLYLLFFSLIPLLYFLLKIRIAKKKKDFHKLSNLLKIIMFLGISSLIIFSIFH